MKKNIFLTLLWLVIIIQSFPALSQSNQSNPDLIESGKFHLFIWRLPVGEENYTMERAGATTVTKSNFEYAYTQKKSSLKTILALRNDLQPEQFEMQGNLLPLIWPPE